MTYPPYIGIIKTCLNVTEFPFPNQPMHIERQTPKTGSYTSVLILYTGCWFRLFFAYMINHIFIPEFTILSCCIFFVRGQTDNLINHRKLKWNKKYEEKKIRGVIFCLQFRYLLADLLVEDFAKRETVGGKTNLL